MFSNVKKAYSQYKADKEYERQLDEDISMRDKMYREEARKQARREFEEERKESIKYRKDFIVAQERKKFDVKRRKLEDTRTKSQKFQCGMKKMGKVAGRITGDVGKMGSGASKFSTMIGNKATKNLGLSGKQESFADKLRRNI